MSQHLLETFEKLPFRIERGQGVHVYDENGTEYLDLYGGHAVSLLGHCPDVITKAISEQASKLFFYSNVADTQIRNDAADALAKIVPSGWGNFFFCNSGAEANENALKLSIRLSGRSKLAAFKGSFHGRSLLCTSVSDNPKTNEELGEWVGDRVEFFKPNDESIFDSLTEEFAAVILEPIQSMAGMTTFDVSYLQKLIETCRSKGIFVIFDEVQTGFGRTGEYFVTGGNGLEPDMMTSAKGIGSGYPIGLFAVHDSLVPKIKVGDLGSTYGAAPVAMAVVKASAEELSKSSVLEHVRKLNERFHQLKDVPGVESIHGSGCLIGIRTKMPAKQLKDQLLNHKIITGTSKDPHVLRLLPPIVLKVEHIDQFESALTECLQ